MLTLECANKTLCQNYTEIYCRLHRYGTALTEEQLGQHEILRAQNRLRTRPQDDIVMFAGAPPLHPVLRMRTKQFDYFVHFTYCFSIFKFVSKPINIFEPSGFR